MGGPFTEPGRSLAAKANAMEGRSERLGEAAWNGGPLPQTPGDLAYQAALPGGKKPDTATTRLLAAIQGRNHSTEDGFGGIGDISGNPQEKAFEAMKATLEQRKLLYATNSGDEERDHATSLALVESYWKVMVSTAKAGTDLYGKIMEEYLKAQAAGVESHWAAERAGASADLGTDVRRPEQGRRGAGEEG